MPKFLKGNYRLPKGKATLARKQARKDLTQQFEERALAKLGGSLCFVMKKGTFVWTDEADEGARQASG
ncbi:MAG: hypothetical protein HYY58_04220 [Candidatus Omnitrophica bacterium]|nr:hypothetical protein [Candidatus Omnitrophota bacterium]